MRGFWTDSPVGKMKIVAQDGSWHLYIQEQFVESYYAPRRALDDLRRHCTGCPAWDGRPDLEISDDLEEWDILA